MRAVVRGSPVLVESTVGLEEERLHQIDGKRPLDTMVVNDSEGSSVALDHYSVANFAVDEELDTLAEAKPGGVSTTCYLLATNEKPQKSEVAEIFDVLKRDALNLRGQLDGVEVSKSSGVESARESAVGDPPLRAVLFPAGAVAANV